METLRLDRETDGGAWSAPWPKRREAGRMDLRAMGTRNAHRALVAAGWSPGDAADWLLEAAMGKEVAGRIALLPQLSIIAPTHVRWLFARADRHKEELA